MRQISSCWVQIRTLYLGIDQKGCDRWPVNMHELNQSIPNTIYVSQKCAFLSLAMTFCIYKAVLIRRFHWIMCAKWIRVNHEKTQLVLEGNDSLCIVSQILFQANQKWYIFRQITSRSIKEQIILWSSYKVISDTPNSVSLAGISPKLTYLSMLFILQLTCTPSSAGQLKNKQHGKLS